MIKFDVETLFFTTNNNKGAPVKLIVTTYTLKKAKVTQYFPSKESKRSEEENTNLGTIQNTSPEEKKTEFNEAKTHEGEEETNTAVNNEQNVMTLDTMKITLMGTSQVKELETTNDDKKDADIFNTNIDPLTMKYYTMTKAIDEDRIFTNESSTIMNKMDIRLEVEEVRSLKAEQSAMIIIDQDDNRSILDTVNILGPPTTIHLIFSITNILGLYGPKINIEQYH